MSKKDFNVKSKETKNMAILYLILLILNIFAFFISPLLSIIASIVVLFLFLYKLRLFFIYHKDDLNDDNDLISYVNDIKLQDKDFLKNDRKALEKGKKN